VLRAAWWALRAIREARRRLPRAGFNGVQLHPPPNLPASAGIGVAAALRLSKQACLVRATVYQAWYGGQGLQRDIVIGVTAPSAGFHAHAWLEGDPPCHGDGFEELLRIRAAISTEQANPLAGLDQKRT
jgi:hypothetical protein